MASFAPIRGTRAQISATPIVDGQFLFETDQGTNNKIYADVNSIRSIVGGNTATGVLPELYIYSETGSTVIVEDEGGTSIVVTQVGVDHWTCELPSYGVYNVYSILDGETVIKSINVNSCMIYTVDETHFHNNIVVTYPSGLNATCQITGGGETYSAPPLNPPDTSYTFVVHQSNTEYTITTNVEGAIKTGTVTTSDVSDDTIPITMQYGTINLTVAPDFVTAGSSITCTQDSTTITKTAQSSMEFYIPTTGTWTISGTVALVDYTVNVVVESLLIPVSAELKTKAEMYSFETCTTQQLADMLESYYSGAYNASDIETLKTTYMPIGAKRTIHINAMSATGVAESHHADDYEFVIIGHEHDDLVTTSSGGKTKALLTLQMDRIFYTNTTATSYSTNYPTAPYEGGNITTDSSSTNSWSGSPRRTWLNNTFVSALPSAIQSLIQKVKKKTSIGNGSSTIYTTQDDAFFLSEVEITGSNSKSIAGEGTQYTYFLEELNKRKNPVYNTRVTAYYWTRSPRNQGSIAFINISGSTTSLSTDYSGGYATMGISPAFCI